VSKPARFLPAAEAELRAAAEWYDDRAGLGDDLSAIAQAVTEQIARTPEAFRPARGVGPTTGAREAPIGPYPYKLIFVELPEEVRIIALAHDRRRPGYWRRRMR
jgi:toxin ParE1/3/4